MMCESTQVTRQRAPVFAAFLLYHNLKDASQMEQPWAFFLSEGEVLFVALHEAR